MAKALTVESYEDELKPLMKPTDSEFKREMRLSIDAETTKDHLEASEIYNDLLVSPYVESVYQVSKAVVKYKIAKSTSLAKIMALLSDKYTEKYAEKIHWVPAIYGGYVGTVLELLPCPYEKALPSLLKKALIEPKKEPLFGISLIGISVRDEKITIDPRKLEPNIFHLFSYKDDKYVARKTDENTLEVYEVLE